MDYIIFLATGLDGGFDFSSLATTGSVLSVTILFMLWLQRMISNGSIALTVEASKATKLKAENAALKLEVALKDDRIAQLECIQEQYFEYLKGEVRVMKEEIEKKCC